VTLIRRVNNLGLVVVPMGFISYLRGDKNDMMLILDDAAWYLVDEQNLLLPGSLNEFYP